MKFHLIRLLPAVIVGLIVVLLPLTTAAESTIKIFPGWGYHHQDLEIDDGLYAWALLGKKDVTTQRNSPNTG